VIAAQGKCRELRAGAGWFARQWQSQHDVALVSGEKVREP
jgi:hypothetical protein